MTDQDVWGMTTRIIHGQDCKDAQGSPSLPLYDTTTFAFKTTEALLSVIEGTHEGNLYTRYGMNPTLRALETMLAALEGAEQAWAFSSGMAALSAVFLAHGQQGIVCVGDCYGGTLELMQTQLPSLGIKTHTLLSSEGDRLASILKAGIGLLFFESPSNPTLDIVDIRAMADLAHAHGAKVVIDSTFATPVNQQPLSLGADLVVHSATKYLGGHSDLTAGAVMGSTAMLKPIAPWRKNLGTAIAPVTAALLARSLRTLPLRVRQQNASAGRIAQFLEGHPQVTRVYYPGLPSHPGHDLACRQMQGFGGMLALDIAGQREDATRVAEKLNLFLLAPSLGGTESLVTQPCTTSHHDVDPAERLRRGIGDTMLRLSVGIEDVDDLLADLEQALS